MSENNFVSVKEYFEKGTFVIPYYQRGFKWSLLKNDDNITHLTQLLIDFKNAFITNSDSDYHLQGVTVKINDKNEIELVDGQQRTTSLFLILLYAYKEKIFAKDEFFKKYLTLDYAIRREVNIWIYSKKNNKKWEIDENIQDIAAFNKALEQIDEKLQDEKLKDKKEDFFNYILNKVKLIYIVLNTEPTKVFSMMNKEKATMTKTELVKSHLLSEASRQAFADLDTNEDGSNEWQINHLRSHFAREWDSWLKWWKNKENWSFFYKSIPEIKNKSKIKNEPEVSRLLGLYYSINTPTNHKNDLTKQNLFSEYCKLIDDNDQKDGNKRIEAVETFEGLRLLQNIIEEWHDDPVIYNYIGMLCRSFIDNKFEIIKYLIGIYENGKNNFKEKLKGIANWSLIPNVKIEDLKSIYENNGITNELKENRQVEKDNLSSEIVYGPFNNSALKQLLRMNIEELGEDKKINFDIFDEQTLEHIQPQSKVITKDSKIYTSDDPINKDTEEYKEEKSPEEYLDFRCTNEISEHCIGNLVLLEGYKNSSVGTKTLNEKKKILFDKIKNGTLLLHTIKIFTKTFKKTTQNESWTIEDIIANKIYFEQEFNTCYKLEGE